MANHASHAALPFPVKNARFTVEVPYLDADGDPTDPTTPDSEFSLDNGAFADCAEETTVATGGRGGGILTLTGAETNGSCLKLWLGAASGPKATVMTIYPRVLPILWSGTATAGAAGSITLPTSVPRVLAKLIVGCIIRTTGGTGGGGTGGANNQARVCTGFTTAGVASVEPNWEVTVDGTTTFDVLLTETAQAAFVGLVPLEPAAAPSWTSTIAEWFAWLGALSRNKITQTSSTQAIRNDADAGNIATAAVSDDGTTTVRGEFG